MARAPAARSLLGVGDSTTLQTSPNVSTISTIPIPYGRMELTDVMTHGLTPTSARDARGERIRRRRPVNQSAARNAMPTASPNTRRPRSVRPSPEATHPRRMSVERSGNPSYGSMVRVLDKDGMLANSALLTSSRQRGPAWVRNEIWRKRATAVRRIATLHSAGPTQSRPGRSLATRVVFGFRLVTTCSVPPPRSPA